MPKPKTKEELQILGKVNFDKLNAFVDSFSDDEKEVDFIPGTMNRNIRDVLAHLHHWHLMMLNWYEVGMQGEKPEIPAPGYSWKDTPDLNKVIWEKYLEIPLRDVRVILKKSYNEVQKVIESHSNEELYEKKRYPWTGSTSLGAYLISNTSSHYDWAYKLIKRAKKSFS